jgi:hypothetical protein
MFDMTSGAGSKSAFVTDRWDSLFDFERVVEPYIAGWFPPGDFIPVQNAAQRSCASDAQVEVGNDGARRGRTRIGKKRILGAHDESLDRSLALAVATLGRARHGDRGVPGQVER